MATPLPVAQPRPLAGCNQVVGLGCLLLFVGVVAVFALGVFSAFNAEPLSKTTQESRFNRIPYETTRAWTIGPDGIGKEIAFKPSASRLDEQTLRDLGATLRADTVGKDEVHIMIFSDVRAAKLQRKWAEWKTTKAETALCDRSYVGLYDRRPAGRYEKLDCVLDGFSGKRLFVVDYTKP